MREVPDKPPEFDAYARDYAELIRDPIRERFAAEGRFFVERKLQVICGFYSGLKVDTHRLHWLDVGCGGGDLLRTGRPLFARSVGCDPSPGMLQSCADLEVRLQPAIAKIPYDANSFDFVTTVCVYHHVSEEDRPLLTSEVLRVLRPGGVLAVIEHNPLNPVTRLIVARTPVDANAKLLTAAAARRLISSAGARVLQTRYFLLLPERVYKSFNAIEVALAGLPLGGQYAVFGIRSLRDAESIHRHA
jgi:SAM-dependent methyltransferase